jgi:serine/threonine protein kinase/Tfp pilus assembly protein PilF
MQYDEGRISSLIILSRQGEVMEIRQQFEKWYRSYPDESLAYSCVSQWYLQHYPQTSPEFLSENYPTLGILEGFLSEDEIYRFLQSFSKHKTLLEYPQENDDSSKSNEGESTISSAQTLLEYPEEEASAREKQETFHVKKTLKEDSKKSTRKQTGSFQEELPSHFGQYEVLEKIATGGMGIVYKVLHPKLNLAYALKSIRVEEQEKEGIARFEREAQTIAKLKHSGIVNIIDFGQENSRHYLVMEFVEGQTLAQTIESGELSIVEGVTIIQKALEALHYAHEQGVLHRDLKPDNLFITKEGLPKIGDFGLAKDRNFDKASKLTRSGVIMGTPAYMSPEQAEGRLEELTVRSDVYSMGICLYEVLAGICPFEGRTLSELFYKITTQEIEVPSKKRSEIPRELDTIVLKATRKKSYKRYRTAKAFAEDLEHFLKGEPILARPQSTVEWGIEWVRKRQHYVGFSLVVLALVFSFLGYLWWDRLRLEKEKESQIQAQEKQERENVHHFLFRLKNEILSPALQEEILLELSSIKKVSLLQEIEELFKAEQALIKEKGLSALQIQLYKNLIKCLRRTKSESFKKMLWEAFVPFYQNFSLYKEEEKENLFSLLRTFLQSILYFEDYDFLEKLAPLRPLKAPDKKEETLLESYYQQLLMSFKILKRPEDYGERAKVFYQKQDYISALLDYDEALIKEFKNVRWHEGKGLVLMQLKRYPEAILAFSEALKLEPEKASLYNYRGQVFVASHEKDSALSDFSQALSCQPTYAEAYLNRANLYRELQKEAEALKDFDKAIELEPQNPLFYENRGEFYLLLYKKDLHKEYQKNAFKDFQKIYQLQPQRTAITYTLAQIKYELEDLEESFQYIEIYLLAYPQDSKGYVLRGLYFSQRDSQKALFDFEKALEYNPQSAHAYYYRGKLYYDLLGKESEAKKDFEKAIELQPSFIEAYLQLGQLLYGKNQWDHALNTFEKACQLDSTLLQKKNFKGEPYSLFLKQLKEHLDKK